MGRSSVVARNEVYWANLVPPAGRRPVVVLTRSGAISSLERLTCAAITTRVRGARAEVSLGRDDGLPKDGVINCHDVRPVPRAALDPEPITRLSPWKVSELDQALRYALQIRY